MKFSRIFALIISIVAFNAHAAFITLEDIDNIQVDLNGWTLDQNTSLDGLFDGIFLDSNGGARVSGENYIRFRDGNVADAVTVTAYLTQDFIDRGLFIDQIGIANDFGGLTQQSATSLLFSVNRNSIPELDIGLNSDTFNNQFFDLDSQIGGVESFSFTLFAESNSQLEVRELFVRAVDVSEPESALLFSILAVGFFLVRRKS
jgi:hypothetical protein